jgi:hypothetical protein
MLLDCLAAIVKEREANRLALSKSDRLKLGAAIHPDPTRDEAGRKRLAQASQIFNALPITEIDSG